jgi:hypothetical protein
MTSMTLIATYDRVREPRADRDDVIPKGTELSGAVFTRKAGEDGERDGDRIVLE